MTKAELRKLVDEGRSIKEKIDALTKRQSEIKKVLLIEAEKNKVDHFFGDKYFARISPMSTTVCEPSVYYTLMEDTGRLDEFFDSISVLVGKARKLIGETAFEEISDTSINPYAKVSFLKKIPADFK
jgi:hypothetical protein